MTMKATIEVTGLRKRFGSAAAGRHVVHGAADQVTGLVGPNGEGKSTTMRVIAGLDAASAGSALVGGRPYRSLRYPLSHVGALLDAAALQPSRSARNHPVWLAHSQGLTARRADEVIGQAGGLSLGMRQRLGIAAALPGPPMIILDEPLNGMDPGGHRVDVRLPAVAGRPGPRGPGVQRAGGYRGPSGGDRPRQGHRPHQRGGADRGYLQWPGHAAHHRPAGGDDGAETNGGHRDRHRPGHARMNLLAAIAAA